MNFEDYIRFIKHMNMEQFNRMSLEAKLQIEYEYNIEYGF